MHVGARRQRRRGCGRGHSHRSRRAPLRLDSRARVRSAHPLRARRNSVSLANYRQRRGWLRFPLLSDSKPGWLDRNQCWIRLERRHRHRNRPSRRANRGQRSWRLHGNGMCLCSGSGRAWIEGLGSFPNRLHRRTRQTCRRCLRNRRCAPGRDASLRARRSRRPSYIGSGVLSSSSEPNRSCRLKYVLRAAACRWLGVDRGKQRRSSATSRLLPGHARKRLQGASSRQIGCRGLRQAVRRML